MEYMMQKILLALLVFPTLSCANTIQINSLEYSFEPIISYNEQQTSKFNSQEYPFASQASHKKSKFPNGNTTTTVFENGITDYTDRIIYNTSNNEESLITGNLMVELGAKSAEDIAREYNITLTHHFAHLKLAFYTPNQQDLFVVRDTLQQDRDINKASIEIITHLQYSN